MLFGKCVSQPHGTGHALQAADQVAIPDLGAAVRRQAGRLIHSEKVGMAVDDSALDPRTERRAQWRACPRVGVGIGLHGRFQLNGLPSA